MGSDIRAIDRGHYYDDVRLRLAYAERNRLLRLMCDTDFRKKEVRPSKTYDEPWSGIREPRKCSWCNQPTIFTTPRGRSVHPACEGWVDDLTERGQVDLFYAVSAVLPVKSVEVKQK